MSTYCNEGVFYDSNVILFLIFFIEAYVVGTHFNCFDFFFTKAYVVGNLTGVIPKSLPVLSTKPVLRKAAVNREIWFSTEQYGCRQRDNTILTPLERRKRLQTLSIF